MSRHITELSSLLCGLQGRGLSPPGFLGFCRSEIKYFRALFKAGA